MSPRKSPARQRLSKAFIALTAMCAIALIGARLYLPFWVKDYVNAQLARLNGYGGSVADIDIALWRGAYQIHGLNIYKIKGGIREPFVAAKTTDLSVEWPALWHGRIVAEVAFYDVDINFARQQTGRGSDWGGFVDSLSPFDINRITVAGGKVAYRDPVAKPAVNIYVADIKGSVTNLRNTEDRETALPSDLQVSGVSIGQGRLEAKGRMNIVKPVLDFDLDVKLTDAALPAFNDFTQASAGVEFASGKAGVFSELAAADGRLTGYIKFLALNVAVEPPNSRDNIFDAMWSGIAAAFIAVFKNHPKDQFALRIPIAGNLDSPKEDGWSAFFSIFQNAFGKAFTRNTDGSIGFFDALRKSDK